MIDKESLLNRFDKSVWEIDINKMGDGCKFLIKFIRLMIKTEPEIENNDEGLRKILIEMIDASEKAGDDSIASALKNALQLWEYRKNEQR